MPRFWSLSLLALFAASASAAHYTFTPLPQTGTARVAVKLDKGQATEFRMPSWAPGDYDLINYGRFVEAIEFKKSGQPATAEHSTADVNLWTVPAGADEAIYTVKPSQGNFSPNLRVTATQAFVNGPGVYGWFQGDQLNRQFLEVALTPAGAKAISTLDPVPSAPGRASFEAINYDEMIDAPLVVGTGIRTEDFQVHGKPLKVVAFNRSESVDLAGFVKVGTSAAQGCFALFGELPFPRYDFFCDFGGGGGGLEHLNSCRLGMGVGSKAENSVGFIFHEFFHCYNVKRIRAKPLGPFDYTKPAMTATIWWLEGVTDYYADVLTYRTGYETKAQFVNGIATSMSNSTRNPNRLKVSADEASLKVWDVHGSYGYGGISYYAKGHLIGACLDLAIRGKSNGKYSLDNVMRDLYAECKDRKPGFGEERIRELCVKYGGPALGPIYDTCARKATDLPVAEVAKAAGMNWDGNSFSSDLSANPVLQKVGQQWPDPVEKPEESFLLLQMR